ncbi:MAG: phosphodiester glycosidase family protein [Cyanobacteria bacterium REEB65]|nr:phosphodiester glycosidase family protein [Cyanobacteria bacterium REEB65]
MNGSFFCPRNRRPMDLLMVGGEVLAQPVSRPALVVKADGTASILPDRRVVLADALSAMGGGPTLLQDGRIVLAGRPHDISGREPRTAVGLLPGERVLLVTIDGRTQASVGATLPEEARYLRALGAVEAINLDGGGSTTMVVKGHVVNHPSDGGERAVSNALLVYPKRIFTRLPLRLMRFSGWDLPTS